MDDEMMDPAADNADELLDEEETELDDPVETGDEEEKDTW